jgi:hypothetical protein
MSNRQLIKSAHVWALADHRKDVSEFEKQSTRGTDVDLKAFASKTLAQKHKRLS